MVYLKKKGQSSSGKFNISVRSYYFMDLHRPC